MVDDIDRDDGSKTSMPDGTVYDLASGNGESVVDDDAYEEVKPLPAKEPNHIYGNSAPKPPERGRGPGTSRPDLLVDDAVAESDDGVYEDVEPLPLPQKSTKPAENEEGDIYETYDLDASGKDFSGQNSLSSSQPSEGYQSADDEEIYETYDEETSVSSAENYPDDVYEEVNPLPPKSGEAPEIEETYSQADSASLLPSKDQGVAKQDLRAKFKAELEAKLQAKKTAEQASGVRRKGRGRKLPPIPGGAKKVARHSDEAPSVSVAPKDSSALNGSGKTFDGARG